MKNKTQPAQLKRKAKTILERLYRLDKDRGGSWRLRRAASEIRLFIDEDCVKAKDYPQSKPVMP